MGYITFMIQTKNKEDNPLPMSFDTKILVRLRKALASNIKLRHTRKKELRSISSPNCPSRLPRGDPQKDVRKGKAGARGGTRSPRFSLSFQPRPHRPTRMQKPHLTK